MVVMTTMLVNHYRISEDNYSVIVGRNMHAKFQLPMPNSCRIIAL